MMMNEYSPRLQAQVLKLSSSSCNGLCGYNFITKPLLTFLTNQTVPNSFSFSSFHKKRRGRCSASREYDYREIGNQDWEKPTWG